MMHTPIAFSIIIPYHLTPSSDRRQYMDALARSIPDREGVEVLWIDDRSTLPWIPPHTIATQHKVFQTIPGERYAGPARNVGITSAQGRWVLFCDSDDMVNTQALNSTFDTILTDEAQGHAADLYASLTNATTTNRSTTLDLYENTVWKRAQAAGTSLPLVYHYPPWSKIIKRAFVIKHDLAFGAQKAGQDAIFSASLAISQPVTIFLPTPWYTYTVPDAQRKRSPEAIQGRYEAHRFVQHLLRTHNLHPMRVGALQLTAQSFKDAPWTTLIETAKTLQARSFLAPISTLGPRIQRRLRRG